MNLVHLDWFSCWVATISGKFYRIVSMMLSYRSLTLFHLTIQIESGLISIWLLMLLKIKSPGSLHGIEVQWRMKTYDYMFRDVDFSPVTWCIWISHIRYWFQMSSIQHWNHSSIFTIQNHPNIPNMQFMIAICMYTVASHIPFDCSLFVHYFQKLCETIGIRIC